MAFPCSRNEFFSQSPETFRNDSGYVPTPSETAFRQLNLRSTQEIPLKYRSVFEGTPYFNIVQSTVLDDILYSDKSVVVCAPTGSGKTMIFELAIVRMLIKCDEHSLPHNEQKVIYMAPIKALCSQRHQEWQKKFESVGLRCTQLTGDSNNDDFSELERSNIILTTPEKWDSTTRRWHSNIALISQIKLFLIDEVHLLGDECRGATMEAVVSRMKTKHAYLALKSGSSFNNNALRFIAVSATIPNVEDIADWLCPGDSRAAHYSLGSELRPVKLDIVVLGYPCYTDSEFKFDISLNYKVKSVIENYSGQKPTLVFCSTRRSVEQAAVRLTVDSRFVFSEMHQRLLNQIANLVRCQKLRECLMAGVAYHHAGLDLRDRQLIEKGFVSGHILVLLSTSTLAMGVNLPAHLVIVKSTSHYVKGVCEEYSQSEIMQMVGRAGRPQFDTSATAVIMTKNQNRNRYENLVSGTKSIESSLHNHLIEHLNAEIVLGTIPDISFTLEWIRSTFLYIRVLKNPTHYGYPKNLHTNEVEGLLHEMCTSHLNALESEGLVILKDSFEPNVLQPTLNGRLMAQYCVTFETMKDFIHLSDTPTTQELISLVANCKEFRDITLRVSEKTVLNQLNKNKSSTTIRYPMEGKIKNTQMKVNCLLQAVLGNLQLQDFALQQDVTKIFRTAIRVSRCFMEYQYQSNNYASVLNAVKFAQCIKARMWENSPFVCRQLPGIGPVLANSLANAGVKTFDDAAKKNPRDIELIVNRHPPFGNQMLDAVRYLPKYDVTLEQLSSRYVAKTLKVTVALKNSQDLAKKKTIYGRHACILLIGDSNNNVILKQKLTDFQLLHSRWSSNFELKNVTNDLQLKVAFCSQECVGMDVEFVWSPFGRNVAPSGSTDNSSHKSRYFGLAEVPVEDDIPSLYASPNDKRQKSTSWKKASPCPHTSKPGPSKLSYSSRNVSNWMSQFSYQKKPNYTPITSRPLWGNTPIVIQDDEDNDDADCAISEYLALVKNTDETNDYSWDGEISAGNKRKQEASFVENPVRKRLNFHDGSSHFNDTSKVDVPLPDFDLTGWNDDWDDLESDTNIKNGTAGNATISEGDDISITDDDDYPTTSGLKYSCDASPKENYQQTPDETPIYKNHYKTDFVSTNTPVARSQIKENCQKYGFKPRFEKENRMPEQGKRIFPGAAGAFSSLRETVQMNKAGFMCTNKPAEERQTKATCQKYEFMPIFQKENRTAEPSAAGRALSPLQEKVQPTSAARKSFLDDIFAKNPEKNSVFSVQTSLRDQHQEERVKPADKTKLQTAQEIYFSILDSFDL